MRHLIRSVSAKETGALKAAAALDHTIFDRLAENVLEHLDNEHGHAFGESAFFNTMVQCFMLCDQCPTEAHFPRFRTLGRGGFGIVAACKRSTTGKLYAVKPMSKRMIKAKKAEHL